MTSWYNHSSSAVNARLPLHLREAVFFYCEEKAMNISNRAKYIETNTVAKAVTVRPDGSAVPVESHIVREHSMNIFLNEVLILRLVCTPGDLAELTAGRLLSGGYIRSADEIEAISICEYGKDARVYLKNHFPGKTGEPAAEAILLESARTPEPTCCTDNRVIMTRRTDGSDPAPLPKAEFRPEWIFSLAEAFHQDSKIHRRTSGTHACYLASQGRILYSAEDIGRHNAMDKAIGAAALQGLDPGRCILFTTGRVPADMVRKAITAGFPILASKSVPTDASIALAKQYNLTLICRAWPDSYEVFHLQEEL